MLVEVIFRANSNIFSFTHTNMWTYVPVQAFSIKDSGSNVILGFVMLVLTHMRTHTHTHTPFQMTFSLMILSIPFIICSPLKSQTSWGRFSSSVTWDMYCWRLLTMPSKPSSFLAHLYPFQQHDRASSQAESPDIGFCFVWSALIPA